MLPRDGHELRIPRQDRTARTPGPGAPIPIRNTPATSTSGERALSPGLGGGGRGAPMASIDRVGPRSQPRDSPPFLWFA